MKQSLLKLVDVILERLQTQPGLHQSERGLRTWLARQGYTPRDIDAALVLVRPRIESAPQVMELGPGVVRQLSPYELFKLSPEARAALARLEIYQLIDPVEREMILDRLDHVEGEVGIQELDYLVSWVVGSNRDTEHQQTIGSVIEGKGRTLH